MRDVLPLSTPRWSFRHLALGLLVLALGSGGAACSASRNTASFSVANARAHVERLAGTIGSRPTGTEPNRRARDYIVGQLRASGFDVRVQEADAERPGYGLTARVANIIATRPGARGQAIALMAHYDSVPDGPGAADDASGVAICIEAGRVLAARPAPAYGLAVILSDGEELGLMGAAALLKDPIRNRIRAALNFEAIGSGAPVMLFETGPASGALLEAWARHAPWPAGASFMPEIYKRISRSGDRTDLGLFRRAGVAGLDFAFVGDGYTYHTPLDAPGRLDVSALERAGDNTVATVEALDQADLADFSQAATTYFDILGWTAVAYGHRGELILFGAAALAGLVAWFHVLGVARRSVPPARIILTAVWLLPGTAAIGAGMLGATWLLRATRASLHPWYAHPDPFLAWLVLAGVVAGWLVVRIGRILPPGAKGSTAPAVVWVMTLPAWIVASVLAGWHASPSAFLVEWPLLAASVALLAFPVERSGGMRAASAAATAMCALLWLPNGLLLLHFVVPELDRSPLVTPLFVYPALLLAFGVFLAPAVLALVGRVAPGARWTAAAATEKAADAGGAKRLTERVGPLLALAAAAAFVAAWLAPAYTAARPLHHALRYVADVAAGEAAWETAANEAAAPPGLAWQQGASALAARLPAGSLTAPFRYHAQAPAPGPAPMSLRGTMVRGTDATLEIVATPVVGGWTVAFALPPGVIPLETNLAISLRRGRHVAVYQAVPPEGITFRGRFELSDADKLGSTLVVATGSGVPGAAWPRLPAWVARDHEVWQARSYYILPIEWRSREDR